MSQVSDRFPRIQPEPAGPPERQRATRITGGWRDDEEGLVEQVLKLARRRKWIILQAFVVVVVAALAYSLQQSKEYTASANLLFTDPVEQVGDSGFNGGVIDPAREAATNNALVQLPAVADYAARTVEGISAGEIYGSVSVDTGSGDSDLVSISAVSTSPQRSADIANAYAQGYIDFRRATERAAFENNIRQLEANLAALPADQQQSPEATRLRAQITALESASALRSGGAELVQRATPPTSASSPKTTRNVVLAGIVGIVLGFLLAALFDRLDQRLRTVEDFERIYGVPALAEIPRSRRLHERALRADTDDPDAEPFRMLRTNLRFLGVRDELRSLLIASPVRGEGKSTIARSLAVTMAAMGDDVVLVEADLHQRPANPAAHGLSTALLGDDLGEALTAVPVSEEADGEVRQLTVLPAGPPAPNPSELLESERMGWLLEQLQEHFEFVIVDAPATTSVSDGLSLVPAVSSVLIVGGLGYTTARAAGALRQQLDLLGGRPVGVAVNYAQPPTNGYGYRS